MSRVSPTDLPAVTYFYKKFREHGCTAEAAWNSARSQVHFRKRLAADVAEHKRRSKAAKAAWKRRKASNAY